jgi:leader peptidase (prepilin peptidase) / N-methyltransferase
MTSPFELEPMPLALIVAIGAIFGLMVGSFLNVCIYRLPRNESIVFPASHCTACGKEIRWYQNVPVVSWLLLRGKCGSCGEPISIVYPLVELLTSAIVALHVYVIGVDLLLIPRVLFACGLIVLAFIDLRHRILPNQITLGGTVVGFLFSLWLPPGWLSSLIGIVIGGGVLFAIGEIYMKVRGIEGMGMGDVKMLGMIGAFLGWQGVLVTLVLASLSGAIVGGIMLATQKGDMKYQLPFGTFLSAAALVASLYGEALIRWYLSLTVV